MQDNHQQHECSCSENDLQSSHPPKNVLTQQPSKNTLNNYLISQAQSLMVPSTGLKPKVVFSPDSF